MRRHVRSLPPVVLIAWFALTALGAGRAAGAPAPAPAHTAALPCLAARESGLPLPSRFSKDGDPAAFQDLLSKFLTGDRYERLGWCEDKTLRDTGPYLDGTYYGTHPVVRIWYSPSFARWLVGGRQGEVPDGATIVKEQFDTPPAGQYAGWTPEQIRAYFFDHYDWTVMIRDRQGAADGWYWAEAFKGMPPDSYAPPFAVFNSGFGLYCLRCHASAEKEMTFSSTTNLQGLPGQPLTFRDDLSWFWNDPLVPPTVAAHARAATREEGAPLLPLVPGHPTALEELESTHPRVFARLMPRLAAPAPAASADWTAFFGDTGVAPAPHPFPGENYDHVVSPAGKPQRFVTSDQCFGCHSGNRYGNVMLWADTSLPSKPLVNVSPYGEWRWSPMGLAGRDPIFHAQLESEIAYLGEGPPRPGRPGRRSLLQLPRRDGRAAARARQRRQGALHAGDRRRQEPPRSPLRVRRPGPRRRQLRRLPPRGVDRGRERHALHHRALDRPLPLHAGRRDVRAVREADHRADEQLARRQAGARHLRLESAPLRHLPRDRAAGPRRPGVAARDGHEDGGERREDRRRAGRRPRHLLRAGDLSRMAEQRLRERDRSRPPSRRAELPGLPHEGGAPRRHDPDADRRRRGRQVPGGRPPRGERRPRRPPARERLRAPPAPGAERLPPRPLRAVERPARRPHLRLHGERLQRQGAAERHPLRHAELPRAGGEGDGDGRGRQPGRLRKRRHDDVDGRRHGDQPHRPPLPERRELPPRLPRFRGARSGDRERALRVRADELDRRPGRHERPRPPLGEERLRRPRRPRLPAPLLVARRAHHPLRPGRDLRRAAEKRQRRLHHQLRAPGRPLQGQPHPAARLAQVRPRPGAAQRPPPRGHLAPAHRRRPALRRSPRSPRRERRPLRRPRPRRNDARRA